MDEGELIVGMINANKGDVDRRLENIEAKIDELLKFKWQIIAGSIMLSTFITILIQVGSFFFKAKS